MKSKNNVYLEEHCICKTYRYNSQCFVETGRENEIVKTISTKNIDEGKKEFYEKHRGKT